MRRKSIDELIWFKNALLEIAQRRPGSGTTSEQPTEAQRHDQEIELLIQLSRHWSAQAEDTAAPMQYAECELFECLFVERQ
ncbi:MAG: hypothetical protein KDD69_15315 [Bdellovibrionales bacterium]|nr:hypothetical protein [Bdellovibrionales bacterium]